MGPGIVRGNLTRRGKKTSTAERKSDSLRRCTASRSKIICHGDQGHFGKKICGQAERGASKDAVPIAVRRWPRPRDKQPVRSMPSPASSGRKARASTTGFTRATDKAPRDFNAAAVRRFSASVPLRAARIRQAPMRLHRLARPERQTSCAASSQTVNTNPSPARGERQTYPGRAVSFLSAWLFTQPACHLLSLLDPHPQSGI